MTTRRLIPTQRAVSQIVNDFAEGYLAIPEIQRDVVWKPDQVKELIFMSFNSTWMNEDVNHFMKQFALYSSGLFICYR